MLFVCGNVYSLGPHYPQLQQATHKLAQTTKCENAKKITIFWYLHLNSEFPQAVCLSLYLHLGLTSCLILCSAMSIQGLLRRLHLKRSATWLQDSLAPTKTSWGMAFAFSSEHSNTKCLSGTNEFAQTQKGEFYTFKDTEYITNDYSPKPPTFFSLFNFKSLDLKFKFWQITNTIFPWFFWIQNLYSTLQSNWHLFYC